MILVLLVVLYKIQLQYNYYSDGMDVNLLKTKIELFINIYYIPKLKYFSLLKFTLQLNMLDFNFIIQNL